MSQETAAPVPETPVVEQTEVKVKKPRKSPNLPPPVVVGKDKQGRDILEGPFHGKYVEVVSKNGKKRRYYEKSENSKTLKKTKTPKEPAARGLKRKAEAPLSESESDADEVMEESEEEAPSQAATQLTEKLAEAVQTTRRVRRKTVADASQ